MQDRFGRVIDYLRISLTDRCNFRCSYCMPPEGIRLLDIREILSYEELLRIIRILGCHGVSKVRLTGGEPLVRKGIVEFVRSVRELGLINDLSMTTNGSLLSNMAHQLKAAGLDRVNISIDTLNPERFTRITGGGRLEDTLKGIKSAIKAQLMPVKLNVVVTEALSEEDIDYFIAQVCEYPLVVRFIEYMPIGYSTVQTGLSLTAVKNIINDAGCGVLEPASVQGNGPARYYRLPQARGVFGFITPISEHFCHHCNRIRLTADGKIKPCLLSNREFDIKSVLRSEVSDREIYEMFLQAVENKPAGHKLGDNGKNNKLRRGMSQVGG